MTIHDRTHTVVARGLLGEACGRVAELPQPAPISIRITGVAQSSISVSTRMALKGLGTEEDRQHHIQHDLAKTAIHQHQHELCSRSNTE
jgi:hypothetical protein